MFRVTIANVANFISTIPGRQAAKSRCLPRQGGGLASSLPGRPRRSRAFGFGAAVGAAGLEQDVARQDADHASGDRKSGGEGKRVSERVVLGGRRRLKKKKKQYT